MLSLNVQSLVKYLLEGVAVAAAAFYLNRRNQNVREVAMIGLVAAATFLVLDQFAPAVGLGARQGSGFGIGANLVGGSQQEQQYQDMDMDMSME